MKSMTMRSLKVLTVAAVVIAALVARGVEAGETKITTAELLRAQQLGAAEDPGNLVATADILAVNDEMRAFVKENVNPMATDVFKLQQLIDAIMGKSSFGLVYDENTRNAAETFATHHGNCLSFANMFVALAREAGLRVEFQEVDVPPDWSMRKDVFVLNRHVNVAVNLGAAGVHVVDFNISDFKTTYSLRTIPDRRAAAHFYNNLGVERMQAEDTVAAVAFFRRAIVEGDGDFSPAWTNLGTIYRRSGHLRHAEAAYLEALEADKQDGVAMSNLVSVYEMMGDTDKAEAYRNRVEEHRMRNPYYRLWLARDAFFERDYDTAIDHLKQAIRREKNEDEFYFLLGLSYLMIGDEDEARRWMTKAESVAATDPAKQRYSTKIETLLSASEKVD